jgi:hypothetical protein
VDHIRVRRWKGIETVDNETVVTRSKGQKAVHYFDRVGARPSAIDGPIDGPDDVTEASMARTNRSTSLTVSPPHSSLCVSIPRRGTAYTAAWDRLRRKQVLAVLTGSVRACCKAMTLGAFVVSLGALPDTAGAS